MNAYTRYVLITPHAVTGAAIGAIVGGNPLVIVVAAIASHYLLDSMPHWQETLAPYTPTWRTWVRIPIDLVLGVCLVTLVAYWHPEHVWLVWLGAAAGNLPDLDTLLIIFPRFKHGVLRRHYEWHCKIQRETSSFIGVITQFVTVTVAMIAARL